MSPGPPPPVPAAPRAAQSGDGPGSRPLLTPRRSWPQKSILARGPTRGGWAKPWGSEHGRRVLRHLSPPSARVRLSLRRHLSPSQVSLHSWTVGWQRVALSPGPVTAGDRPRPEGDGGGVPAQRHPGRLPCAPHPTPPHCVLSPRKERGWGWRTPADASPSLTVLPFGSGFVFRGISSYA